MAEKVYFSIPPWKESESNVSNWPKPHLVLNELDYFDCGAEKGYERYVWFLADEARKAFAKLTAMAPFSGHNFIGYVSIYVRHPDELYPYIVELSRGGDQKSRPGPRRPQIEFFRYLKDGTRLKSVVTLGLFEPDVESERLAMLLEFMIEQSVIRAAMKALALSNSNDNPHARQSIIDTAKSIILSFDPERTASMKIMRDVADSYGINSQSELWRKAEDSAYSLLSMIDPA